ncbi:hypothetical protein MSUIS_01740 [Mycoplasma suis KI3806]|uniref:Uncharacterized protein n=1 Tax=Mycoplasma suis (strain KI_3806) TaxID=708248 RepID=F0V345_MYCS3|nr:hypothetical protein [Mycoplasma suis]CBZ40267.1 hypothetical protein MSUIS_01740 [Mycoplasma suis KI3806]
MENINKQGENLEILSVESQDSTLFFEKEIDSFSNSVTVQQLYKEVKKDSETRKIEGESKRNLEEAKEKVSNHSSNFQKVKEEIKKWEEKNKVQVLESNSSETSRSKRQTQQVKEEVNILPQDERLALFCFYKKFSELRDKKKGLSKQLQNVEEGRNSGELEPQALSSKSGILEALEKIGWKEQNMDKLGKYLRGEIKDDGDPIAILLGNFELLQTLRDKSNEWKKKTEDFIRGQRSRRRVGWSDPRHDELLNSSLDIFKKQAGSVEGEVVMKIASRLMGEMSTEDLEGILSEKQE